MSEQGGAPTTVRIVQVSDTHVSGKRAYFQDNWEVFVAEMAQAPPALVVHSGDVSFDGADDAEDLAFARAQMDRLAVPWVAIPGNHDIGECPPEARLDQPIDDRRMAAWSRHFGASCWVRDLGGARLVGIDSALLGSDLPQEGAQRRFLETALAERAGRPVLLFQHMPPFLLDPDDAAPTHLGVPHRAREWLRETCRTGGVAAIACGHVHIYRHVQWAGMDVVWAPATSFVNIAERQKARMGFPRAGYLEWTLRSGRINHRLIEPALMLTHDVGAWNRAHGSTTHMPPRPLR